MQMANVVAKWEARLRREGLAPLDQLIGGRTVIRTEIITPMHCHLPDPGRLADALRAWLSGDESRFDADGLAILRRVPNQVPWGETQRYPRDRARVLLRVCVGLGDGLDLKAASGSRSAESLALRHLLPLYARLREEEMPLGDDADDTGRGD